MCLDWSDSKLTADTADSRGLFRIYNIILIAKLGPSFG